MAKYTVELRSLMSDPTVEPKLQEALSTYPIYTSENQNVADLIPTREELNRKLLRHYKYREIGFETVGRFLDELQITMEEIMPYYNQMYHTVEIMAELPSPFDNVDVIERTKETRTTSGKTTDSGSVNSSASDSSETTSNVNSNSKNLTSDTPQGNIGVSASNIDSVTRANNASWTKNTSNDTASTTGSSSTNTTNSNESNSEGTETVEHEYTKTGNQGVNTYAHDMNEFRTSIIDVTMQIIEDKRIAELFMMVY